MEGELFVIERLVYERWGGSPPTDGEVDRALARIARREGWIFEVLEEVSAYPSSYRGLTWLDRWGRIIGWSLHTLNIAAVSARRPVSGLPPDFDLTSQGPLFEALSADGSLILPAADWLLTPLPEPERAALRASTVNGGWESYNFRYWKPHTRAEALFTHWD